MPRLRAVRRSESWVVEQPKQEQLCGYDEQWFRNLPKYQVFFIAVAKFEHAVKFTIELDSPLGQMPGCVSTSECSVSIREWSDCLCETCAALTLCRSLF